MVFSFAVVASKDAGRSFENEQIGHTHAIGCLLALSGSGDTVPELRVPENGEDAELRKGEGSASTLSPTELLPRSNGLLSGFGYSVTFADDFKNPAYQFLV